MGRFNMMMRGALTAPANTVAPVVSGSASQGSILSSTTGTWTGSPTFTYQWKRGGSNISAATSPTYATVLADVGTSVTCAVTGTNGGGSATATSNGVTVTTAASILVPTAQWTGAADSGYGTANPAKPLPVTRSAAKPTLRPLFIQHHFITGADGSDYVVYTSRCRGGVSYVRIWMEGNYVDVTTRSWVTYTDLRGTARKLYGFVAQIDYAATQALHVNGRATICAEAFPVNGAYLKQVAPERTVHLRPGSALIAGNRYDEVKTVGTSADYASLPLAMTYAMGQAASNPNKYIGFKIITSGFHSPECTGFNELLACTHATEVFADTGVTATIGKTSGTSFCTLDGTRLYGPGVRIDTCPTSNPNVTTALGINNDSGSGHLFQAVGIEVYTGSGDGSGNFSGSGAALLYLGEQPGQAWFNNSNGPGGSHIEWKDCNFHDIAAYGFLGAESVINCDMTNVSGSGWENVWGVIHGGSVNQIGGFNCGLRTQKTALTITYGGAGTASWSVTTTSNGSTPYNNGSFGYLNLYVNGIFQTSFSTSTYKTSLALRDAINTYGSSFSATYDATNAGRGMNYLSKAGLEPTDPLYPATNFSGGSAVLTTTYDIHANAIVNHDGTYSNWAAEFVEETELNGTASWSVDNTATMQDAIYANLNALDTSSANSITAQAGYLSGTFQHAGWEHTTDMGAGAGHYIGGTTFDPDCYWLNGYDYHIYYVHSADLDMNWDGLAINGGSGALPSGATTNCATMSSAAESTYISTVGVPILNGGLKVPGGAYRCATLPTSLIDNSQYGNYGWNV